MPEQAAVIRWEDPKPGRGGPASHTTTSRYAEVAEELRRQPMRWAVIAELPGGTTASLATHVRMGAISCFGPAGDFDAVSRQVLGKTAIYARYVGDNSEGN